MPNDIATCLHLTVLFESPFWIGVFERTDSAGYAVARHRFDSEPTDPEIYAFVLGALPTLRFGEPLANAPIAAYEPGFKKKQRATKKTVAERGVSTQAQAAMKLLLQQRKIERKTENRAERDAAAKRQYELRQVKRQEKHRGH